MQPKQKIMAMAEQLNDRGNWNDRNTITGFWKILRIIGWSGAAVILLLPLIFMQFTNEVDWTISDFIFAAIILGGIGLVFEFMIRRSNDDAYRTGVIVALVTMFLLIWSNAAVGIVGSGANIANILYVILITVPIIGALVSGFKSKGMFRTMLVTLIAQLVITFFAYGNGMVEQDQTLAIGAINAIFFVLWIGAALLFRESDRPLGSLPADRSVRISRIQFILSSILIVIGSILLFFMIGVESEPGAIPLLIILIGLVWFAFTWVRSRSAEKNLDN